jgi:DNA replication protein DnaC
MFTPRIQRDFKSITFPTECLQKDLTALQTRGANIYLTGPVGTGKTLYAVALTLAHMEAEYRRRWNVGDHLFVSTPVLLQSIKASFGPDQQSRESELIEKYSAAAWLVLDDFGTEKVSAWTLQVLYLIVNYRYEFLKTTIFTSNLSLDQLAEKLEDDRIPSRINAMCDVRQFNYRDLRV